VRLLVTGASGQLGAYILRSVGGWGGSVIAWSGSRGGESQGHPLRPVDFSDPDQLCAAFREACPAVVIHAGAVASVGACSQNPGRAWRVNADGSAVLARLADAAGARLVQVSTDLVFDGRRGWHREGDPTAPFSVYGRTKVAGEQAVLATRRGAVVRVGLLFGPTLTGKPTFFDEQVAAVRSRQPIRLFEDEWRTPLDLPTAGRALVALARSDFRGPIHLGGPERMSRFEMGRRLAGLLGGDPSSVLPSSREGAGAEPRPRDVSLDSSLWRAQFPEQLGPGWDRAVRLMGLCPSGG